MSDTSYFRVGDIVMCVFSGEVCVIVDIDCRGWTRTEVNAYNFSLRPFELRSMATGKTFYVRGEHIVLVHRSED